MANVIFWDVDTQHDFMVPDGRLYVPDAEHIAPNLKQLTEFARASDILIVATADDHHLDDEEISEHPDFENTFPAHCIHNTPGAHKIPATAMNHPVVVEIEAEPPKALRERVLDHDGEILIKKKRFDVFSNPNTGVVLDALDPAHVVVYGVALDVCDRFAVEGLLSRGATVHLVTDAVRAIRPDRGDALLRQWQARGVRLVTTGQVVGGYLDRL
jgi:nicotinamidase/pyrazinamidase